MRERAFIFFASSSSIRLLGNRSICPKICVRGFCAGCRYAESGIRAHANRSLRAGWTRISRLFVQRSAAGRPQVLRTSVL